MFFGVLASDECSSNARINALHVCRCHVNLSPLQKVQPGFLYVPKLECPLDVGEYLAQKGAAKGAYERARGQG